ncbi:hypothetical protein THRCLA_23262 [Thraustotheca clavata]|uniref:glucan 1,3-beta-glucosidase n=1 Tax=Thraustotheca clavata TaxID=74557 RepID=A0A1V9Y8D1_9STRA|nr:hypothetical protein THRCLA_23262 [Thraustotheca clavata]
MTKDRRGVNLGGWLVLEHWITPESPVFKEGNIPHEIIDNGEYQVMQYLGHERGDALMRSHWANFITEHDFSMMKAIGLDMIRIPIGYWIMHDAMQHYGNNPDVFARGGLMYLDHAMAWAEKYNLKILVGIHAARGSQNGDQHSAPAYSRQIDWFHQENVHNTLQLVEFIVRRYQHHPAFLGIGLLNEPQHSNDAHKFSMLKKYYQDAFQLIRGFLHSNCVITFSNAYNEKPEYQRVWQSFFKNDPNVWAEVHKYYIWGFEGQTFDQIKQYVQGHEAHWIRSWSGAQLFVGEWSIANNEATFILSDAEKHEYAEIMTNVFKPIHWAFWTWKFWNNDPNSYVSWSLKAVFERHIMNKGMLDNTPKTEHESCCLFQ